MALHPQAGQHAAKEQLINVAQLVSQYYSFKPDINDPGQAVSFCTSGHRGTASNATFTDTHISAICPSIGRVS